MVTLHSASCMCTTVGEMRAWQVVCLRCAAQAAYHHSPCSGTLTPRYTLIIPAHLILKRHPAARTSVAVGSQSTLPEQWRLSLATSKGRRTRLVLLQLPLSKTFLWWPQAGGWCCMPLLAGRTWARTGSNVQAPTKLHACEHQQAAFTGMALMWTSKWGR
jgi:hypothetical protein